MAAGIVVKIPVFHWGEGIYKVKAAKAEANIARYKLEDIKEKVELQVTQNSYKVNESTKKLALAEKNMEKAEENLRYANLGFKEGVIRPATYWKHKRLVLGTSRKNRRTDRRQNE